jgi:hypothetical protein
LEEIWDNVTVLTLDEFYTDVRWPDYPDQVSVLSNFYGLHNVANNYSARIRAYLTPEASGTYTFYINSDDSGTLLISSDDDPANATLIASVSTWSGSLTWDKYPEQTSSTVDLVAGQRYFIEARLKENSGGDHLNVGWSGPGITDTVLIPAARLSPYDSNTAPIFDEASYAFNLASDSTAQTAIGTALATSQTFETVTHAILSGDPQKAFAIDQSTGQITLQKTSAIIPGQIFNLTVGAQDNGYDGLFPFKDTSVAVTITVSGTPFQSWRGQHFGSKLGDNQITGDFMDPDKDSVVNLIEYALNLDPNKNDIVNHLPTVSNDNSSLKFTYRKNLNATDLTLNIQQASDLNDSDPWSAATVLNEETLSDDGTTRLIRATLLNPDPAPKRFIRLHIEVN